MVPVPLVTIRSFGGGGLVTGQKVYQAITRGPFNFTDRECGGRRLVNDAPVLIEIISKNPDVRDTAIVAFADRRTGVGLYAIVEADQVALEKQLRSELSSAKGIKPLEHTLDDERSGSRVAEGHSREPQESAGSI